MREKKDNECIANLLKYVNHQQHKPKILTRATSIAFDGHYVYDSMVSVQKSCYGVMQQAYSMPSIVMNGEQTISTGQTWCTEGLTRE